MLKAFIASLNEVGGIQAPPYFSWKHVKLKEAFHRSFEDPSKLGILLPMLLQKCLQLFSGTFFRRCLIYLFEVAKDFLTVFIADIARNSTRQVHLALLVLSFRKLPFYGVAHTFQTIGSKEKHFLNTTLLDGCQHFLVI